ncbi:MAG: hypothetical protein V3S07_03450 [Micropepsaceae bacterium]
MSAKLPFETSLSLALTGDGAPDRDAFNTALGESKAHLAELLNAPDPLELLTILDREDDLAAAADLAKNFSKHADKIFVLGIGGSSAGGHALSYLLPYANEHVPRVMFFSNLDHSVFVAALAGCNPAKTKFLSISKSGGTAETLIQTLAAAAFLRDKIDQKNIANHFAVVSDAKPSPLRQFSEDIGCPVLDHPLGIGGRYSVLSIVGLLPAFLMGMDAKAFRAGAKAVIDNARANPDADESPAAGAALHAALLRATRLRESVLWSYADQLGMFGAWWRQLWAESLGKGAQGTTPVAALGSADQHSQLQLFLDGPGGALFTLISLASAGDGPRVSSEDAEKLGLSYLAEKTLGDLVAAGAHATAQTLARRGRPVRVIQLGTVNEYALGALFMHFMLETILMARLTGVDPFDQPAVEESKALTRKILQGK